MIFEVNASQISSLDSKQLVMLLRKLIHAEAQKAGINLRGAAIPLQITVSDGGEDARIVWSSGHPSTDYFPSRFTVFQSKATDPGLAGWKKEIWTRSSQRKGAQRELNEAMRVALEKKGSYIGFTNAELGGQKIDAYIDKICEGVAEAGADPKKLKAIDIYDAGKIAAWAARYPAIALWLHEIGSGLSLSAFRTIEVWGKDLDITVTQFVSDDVQKFFLGLGNSDVDEAEDAEPDASSGLTFSQIKERISDHITTSKAAVRVMGPSGVGKTRFAFELLQDNATVAKYINANAVIYCNYSANSQQIEGIINDLSNSATSALFVVDECNREGARRLASMVSREKSLLRLITIDTSTKPISDGMHLNIFVTRSSDALIESILRQKFEKSDPTAISYIRDFSAGYPRIAVLALDHYPSNARLLRSVDDVAERMLTSSGAVESEQVRAIECLALFQRLGGDEGVGAELDIVAEKLARQSGDQMYEHLAAAARRFLVDRRGRYFSVQPPPIAAYLGLRRLEVLRVNVLLEFIKLAPQDVCMALLEQWRHFDTSKTAISVAENLMSSEGMLGTLQALDSGFGSRCLDALVHVAPDAVANALERIFSSVSIDDLLSFKAGRRYLVWALEKLVFRAESFHIAANLLMRLGAAETESWGNNATNQFRQLFQIQLSGTVVPACDRFSILDDGLDMRDNRLLALCISALERGLQYGHFSRSGSADRIGTNVPLQDWQPKTWGDVFEFQRGVLKRLLNVRGSRPDFAKQCEDLLSTNLRSLISENLFDDLSIFIKKIYSDKGVWFEPIEALGDWLYFDRAQADPQLAANVRRLYDELVPSDLVQLALFYTKFWQPDIRDPDKQYSKEDEAARDYNYSTRKSCEVAREIARDEAQVKAVIEAMMGADLKNVFPFARELALWVLNPLEAFQYAVKAYERTGASANFQFIRGMLNGLEDRDLAIANACVHFALEVPALKNQVIGIHTALDLSPERLEAIIVSLQRGAFSPAECVMLSYGRGLDKLPGDRVILLIDELTLKHGAEGVWAALEIIQMYRLGSPMEHSILQRAKKLIVSPMILVAAAPNREGYRLQAVIELINKQGGIENGFAEDVGDQLIRLCQLQDYSIFSAFDDAAREMMKIVVGQCPLAIWSKLSRFFEVATPEERHRLSRLVEPSSHGFGNEAVYSAGPLFGVAEHQLMAWANVDPETRSPFIGSFYPLLSKDSAGRPIWHPDFEGLVQSFGAFAGFRRQISRSLYPRAWSGSIIPHLRVYLPLLIKWYDHPVPEIASWARTKYRALEQEIKLNRKREEEDPYR